MVAQNHKSTIPIIGALVGAAVIAGTTLVIFLSGGYRYVEVPQHYAALTKTQRNIVRLAKDYGPRSGILYVWGGSSRRGFDCSGYVQFVTHLAGASSVPRTSQAQWHSGRFVPKGRERPGDIVFFISGGTRYNPGHAGLYIGHGKMIEYYRSGRPARLGRLRGHWGGYLGARRYWRPVSVRKHIFDPAMYIARHWNVRISADHGWTVTFAPRHHRFPKWKRRAILAWAVAHHKRHKGYYDHINIKLA